MRGARMRAAGDPDIDHRADIYSLGAMAYELLSGQAVFANRTPQRMLAAHMGEAPVHIAELRADVPAGLAELVMRSLEKEPDKRPQQASDIVRALDSITSGGSMQSMPSAPSAMSAAIRPTNSGRPGPPPGRCGACLVVGVVIPITCDNTATDGANCGTCGATCAQDVGASLSTGLLGLWHFDEGSGTTSADSSGNGNTATLFNGVGLPATPFRTDDWPGVTQPH